MGLKHSSEQNECVSRANAGDDYYGLLRREQQDSLRANYTDAFDTHNFLQEDPQGSPTGWLAEVCREADRRPSSSSPRGLWWLFLPHQEMPQMPKRQIKVSLLWTWPETFPSSEPGIQVCAVWVQAVIAVKEAGLDGCLQNIAFFLSSLAVAHMKTKSSCI